MITARRLLALIILSSTLATVSFAYGADLSTGLAGKKPEKQFDLLITWRSESQVPTWYQGRVLPTKNSKIYLSAQGLLNGKNVDLSSHTIAWFIDGTQQMSAVGKTAFSFIAGKYAAAKYTVTAKVVENAIEVASGNTLIPIAPPKLVINIPYADRTLPRNDAILEALMYFFSTIDTAPSTFAWSINDIKMPQSQIFGPLLSASFDAAALDVPVAVRMQIKGASTASFDAITHISIN